MTTFTKEELDEIIKLNTKFNETDGQEGKRADLREADLREADLLRANLRGANLSGAELQYASLFKANLLRANLRGANLSGADLSGANFREANLLRADLSGAEFTGANLSGANLSGAKGILDSSQWLEENFKEDDHGFFVYKRIGETSFDPPKSWIIEPREILEEVPNPDRGADCGSGINFGTKEWCLKNYSEADLWLCHIKWIDLAGIIIPFNTDGKARCAKLELLSKIEEGE